MDTAAPTIWFTSTPSVAALREGIESVSREKCKSLLLLTCIDNQYDEQQTNTILNESPLPICGGMFPQIIFHGNTYSQGALVVGLMFESQIINYTMLSDFNNSDLQTYISQESSCIASYQNFIMIADAFCNTNENFINEFYDYIGSGITVVGGGVGALDFIPRPAIYSNQGLINDAVQVIAVPCLIKKEVGHGWEILDGPYLVTASQGHSVQSLNYIPAFELYRDILNNVAGKDLKLERFFDTAKHFPLGINISGEELLIRDPINSNGSEIECVGNVPLYSTVYLLKGNREKMLLSAEKTAGKLARRDKSKTRLLFDCVSRGFYLEEGIEDEVQAIQQQLPESSLFGAMSIGEITDTPRGAVHLLNKSMVIVAFTDEN